MLTLKAMAAPVDTGLKYLAPIVKLVNVPLLLSLKVFPFDIIISQLVLLLTVIVIFV